jgi:diacylglycerol kinase family enzyme
MTTREGRAVPIARRVAAVASIVFGIIAVVAAAIALVGDAWRVILVPVAVAALVAGGWIAVDRTGRARWIGVAVSVAGTTGFVALVITAGRHGIALVVLLVLAAASTGAARYALGRTRAALRAAPVPGTPVGPARKAVLIINLESGGGKAEQFALDDRCRERGIEPIVLQSGDDLVELARDAVERGADVIGMAGGDGSQALVAAVASATDVPLVCVPAGTRNHFAVDLGLDRDDVVGALDAFAAAMEQRIDLAEVNGRVFVNNVSLGVYARVVQSPEYRDAKAQTVAKLLPEMLGPDAEPFDLRFVDADGVDRTEAQVIQVSNNPYVLTPVGGFGYRRSISTGQLGVVATDMAAGPAVWSEWTVPTFEVESASPIDAGVDGEALVLDPPLQFRIRPGALRVRIPHNAFGYSPAARRSTSPLTAFTDLIAVVLGRVSSSGPVAHVEQ